MENVNDLYDIPGVIITKGNVVKTTKVKKWVSKNRPSDYTIKYVENCSSDFKEVEKQLQQLVDEVNGIHRDVKEKEIFKADREYAYKYRYNVNTIYLAHSKEALQWLLDNNNINVDVNDLYD